MTTAPLSIRQNNPGNIRPLPNGQMWLGQTGSGGGFCIFDTMANGFRALCKQIIVYGEGTRKINWVGYRLVDGVLKPGIIPTWAPPADHNDTHAYIALVCSVLACNQDDLFNVRDPDFLFWIGTAICEEESGHDAFLHYVVDADIDAGIAAALA